ALAFARRGIGRPASRASPPGVHPARARGEVVRGDRGNHQLQSRHGEIEAEPGSERLCPDHRAGTPLGQNRGTFLAGGGVIRGTSFGTRAPLVGTVFGPTEVTPPEWIASSFVINISHL